MPCEKCGHMLIYHEQEPTCPKCTPLAILDSDAAIQISKRRLNHIMDMLKEYLLTLNKQSLLVHVIWQREKYSRSFFEKYDVLDIGRLFAETLLLKRTMLYGSYEGKTLIESETDAIKIIELYDKLKDLENDHSQLRSCYANMIYWKKFKLEQLTMDEMFLNFKIVQNEKYYNLMKSYENYDIYTPEKAGEKLREYQSVYAKITETVNQKPKNYSLEEYVIRFYDLISAMYLGLLRNRLQSFVFSNLRDYAKIMNSPRQLTDFVNAFTAHPTAITSCPTDQFLTRASRHFKKDRDELAKIMLFEESNPNAFPLFARIRMEKESFDQVIISHGFANLIALFLYPFTAKRVFDKVTSIRSKEFEKAVEQEFRNFGFQYLSNQIDNKKKPTLEIDGLAIKDGFCYVAECKKHRLPALTEEDNVKEYMIRDLKGIVDGIKYTTRADGTTIQKQMPSLLEKCDYVDKNKQRWSSGQHPFSQVKPLIVTHDYPFISEYKNVKIIPFTHILRL